MIKFQNVLRLCRGRKVLFDNRTMDNDKKAKQFNQLLAHVADVANQTGGKPYTDNMHRKIKVCFDFLFFFVKQFLHSFKQRKLQSTRLQPERLCGDFVC